jgi:hypothetical protein
MAKASACRPRCRRQRPWFVAAMIVSRWLSPKNLVHSATTLRYSGSAAAYFFVWKSFTACSIADWTYLAISGDKAGSAVRAGRADCENHRGTVRTIVDIWFELQQHARYSERVAPTGTRSDRHPRDCQVELEADRIECGIGWDQARVDGRRGVNWIALGRAADAGHWMGTDADRWVLTARLG